MYACDWRVSLAVYATYLLKPTMGVCLRNLKFHMYLRAFNWVEMSLAKDRAGKGIILLLIQTVGRDSWRHCPHNIHKLRWNLSAPRM